MPESSRMILAGVLLLMIYAVFIGLYHRGWKELEEYRPLGAPRIKISVIVPARNEEKNLPDLLHALAVQSYPSEWFEVIVVNDASTDSTREIVLARKEMNVRLVESLGGSKKSAIAEGIKNAQGELIVTTDADCLPPANWLTILVDFYHNKNSVFIAAPVAYMPRHTVLDTFQTLDFLTLQGITAASVSSGLHSMCNGANLAYKRSAYFDVEGFAGIDHLASGDDMLLMHKIRLAFPGKVHYLKSAGAIVQTRPVSTWKEFFWQRMRWASKSPHYGDPKIKLSLLAVYLFNLYFFVLVLAGFWDSDYWSAAVILLIAKTAIELPFILSVARFYQQQRLVGWFFIMQPLHIFYTVIVGLLSQFGTYYWKGRKLK